MRVTIDKEDDRFLVRPDPEPPGMYKVGWGDTMEEAMGDFLRNYQWELNIQLMVNPAAWPDELARRERELAKR